MFLWKSKRLLVAMGGKLTTLPKKENVIFLCRWNAHSEPHAWKAVVTSACLPTNTCKYGLYLDDDWRIYAYQGVYPSNISTNAQTSFKQGKYHLCCASRYVIPTGFGILHVCFYIVIIRLKHRFRQALLCWVGIL